MTSCAADSGPVVIREPPRIARPQIARSLVAPCPPAATWADRLPANPTILEVAELLARVGGANDACSAQMDRLTRLLQDISDFTD